MGERDDDAAALAEHPAELVLGLGEPARRDRRPLRLERVRLRRAGRDRARRRPRARRARATPRPRCARTSSGSQTKSGARSKAATRSPGGSASSPVVAKARLDEIHAPLRRRVHDRLGDRMERALRERGERPHLLDLVAEELDAKRLTTRAREDVDEPAANGDLASLLDALDALVAGERERLHELVEAELRSRRQPDRAGPRRRPEAGPLRARVRTRTRHRRRRGRRAPAHARRRGAPAAPGPTPSERRGSGRARSALGSTYQPTASAASRACSSSGSSTTSERPSVSYSAARTSGSAGSETLAAAGRALRYAPKRSLAASSATSGRSGVGSMRLAGNGVPRGNRSPLGVSARRARRPRAPIPGRVRRRAERDWNHPQGYARTPTDNLSAISSRLGHALRRVLRLPAEHRRGATRR